MGRTRLPNCRYCGQPLAKEPARIVVSESVRGRRQEWGSCWHPHCMEQFRQATAGVLWFAKNHVVFVQEAKRD